MRKYVLFGVFMLVTGFAISQAVENRTVTKVHSLQIIDETGTIRAEVSTDQWGDAFLRFYDQHGNVEWEASPNAKIMPAGH